MSQMQSVSLGFIQKEMPAFYESKTAMLLIGLPGIGKTEILTQKAHELLKNDSQVQAYFKRSGKSNLPFFVIDMSQIPSESIGIPYIANNSDQHLKRDILKELNDLVAYLEASKAEKAPAIVFIDEMTSATQDDQRTLMNIVQAGKLPNGVKIDTSRVQFILAGNPSASMPGFEDYDGATNDIENAVITRGATFIVEANLKDFISWGTQINPKNDLQNIHPYVTAALSDDPSLFMREDQNDIRTFNSRTAKKLSDYLYTKSEQGDRWEAFSINAFVGDSVGAELCSIMDNLDRLVNVSELWGPETSKTLNKAAFDKFKGLQGYEQMYLVDTLLNNVELANFGIKIPGKKAYYKNNARKFFELLSQGNLQKEVALSVGKKIVDAPAGSNARHLEDVIFLKEPATNVLGWCRDQKVNIQQIH